MPFDDSELHQQLARLAQVEDKVRAEATAIVQKAAMGIQSDAATMAPVDTGYLEGSVSTDIVDLEAQIGPTAHYGRYVEEGTYKMAARPYMGPASDRHIPMFLLAAEQLGSKALQ